MPDRSAGVAGQAGRAGNRRPGLSALARQAAAKTRAVSGRVHDHAVVTPLIGLAAAREECGTDIFLKCEHQQETGSFKVHGALAKVLNPATRRRTAPVICAGQGRTEACDWQQRCRSRRWQAAVVLARPAL
jgi:hypothetical protein